MSTRGVKMANRLISGQAENGRTFNVKVGEGGEGRQVTPPLDKNQSILSLSSSITAFYWGRVCVPQANNTSSVECIVDCTHFVLYRDIYIYIYKVCVWCSSAAEGCF